MSDDLWNFKVKDDLMYIENISKKKVLGMKFGAAYSTENGYNEEMFYNHGLFLPVARANSKVTIEKSHSEVSLMEQDAIENVS